MQITIKKGSTLSFAVTRLNEQGLPVTGKADTMRAQIRDEGGALIEAFIVEETDTPGEYLFSVSAEKTRNMEVGSYNYDIEIRDNDVYQYSDTGKIKIVKAVTHDE